MPSVLFVFKNMSPFKKNQVNKHIGRFIISTDLGAAKLLRVDQKRDQSFTKTKTKCRDQQNASTDKSDNLSFGLFL